VVAAVAGFERTFQMSLAVEVVPSSSVVVEMLDGEALSQMRQGRASGKQMRLWQDEESQVPYLW
jgi:hypothetical protein